MNRAAFLLACALVLPPAAIPRAAAQEDPLAYLENLDDPRTALFFEQQGARARAALDAIPGRDELHARIRALGAAATLVTHVAATPKRTFYLKLEPERASAVLAMREGVGGAERVLLDPARFDDGPRRAAIEWIAPSPDARHVAFGVSVGGGAQAVLRVLAVEGARLLDVAIDRARFNAELAWHPDSRSFYYARVPEANPPGRRYAGIRVYRHELGRAAARDEVVFAPGVGGARDVPEFVFPALHVPEDSPYAYALAREGVRREVAVHVALQKDLAAGRPRWRKLAGAEDEVLAIEGWKDDLYLLTRREAPRHRVVRVKADAASLAGARTVVPQGEAVIEAFGLARDAIYLRTMVAGADRLERVPLGLLGAKAPEFVRTPFDTAISQLVTHPRVPGALLRLQGWIEPPAVVSVEPKSGNLARTPIQPAPQVDFSAMDEVRLYAPGHDGTRIPVTLVYRKTTRLDGRNPTLLVAHGSYGRAVAPVFDPALLAWLERGGIFALAHVRGGGEYGAEWHRAGRRAAKVNAIRDLIAVSDFLVSYGFTGPGRLAIQGTALGGIPAGGALVRRPELYAALVARAPVADVLSFERSPHGPAHAPELGSSALPEEREALRAMSAYHQVRDATPYPAVLLTAGMNHPQVEPSHPAKLAARLQSATSSGKPVLLRVEAHAGNEGALTREQRAAEAADVYAFLLWQMGDPAFQPPAPGAGEAPAGEGPAPQLTPAPEILPAPEAVPAPRRDAP